MANDETTMEMLNATTTYDYAIPKENVVYQFAIQAVNEGGSGPMSNYMAVFYCSTSEALIQRM